MNGIVNGSVLKFESKVTIPASGLGFTTLKFVDPLSEGLEYVTSSAKIKYATLAETSTNAFSESFDATTRELILLITDSAIVAPSADTSVTIDFEVKVIDVTKALVSNELTNSYTFSMLDAGNIPIGNPVNGDISQPLSPYKLFVMGVPSTINKAANIPANAIYFFGALSGYGNSTLDYSFVIEKTIGFDFPADLSTVKGTLDTVAGNVIPNFVPTVDATTGNILITFPFNESFRDRLLFINVPLTTTSAIANVTSPALVYGDASLMDGNNIVVDSPKYGAQINLVEMVLPKSLTGDSKTLII